MQLEGEKLLVFTNVFPAQSDEGLHLASLQFRCLQKQKLINEWKKASGCVRFRRAAVG